MLGRLEVVDDDRQLELPRGRVRALLGLLALRAGEVVSTERLIDQLWGPTPPPTAVKALHGLVSILRGRLEPDRDRGASGELLETWTPGYLLALDRDRVDVHRFRNLVEEATGAPAATQAVLLREALGMWRGPALDDLAYEPFAQTAIADLEELRLTALEQRVEADLALGRHVQLVAELEGLTAEHPLRERLRSQLMLTLYRCGRQAEALEVYRDLRRELIDEVGVEPAPALRELQQAILAQDPALEAPVAPASGPAEGPAEGPAGRSWLPVGRKPVTVVFTDLSPSAAPQHGETADPEATRPVVRRAYQTAVEVFERHGGTVEGFVGEVVVTVFGLPVAHEDDASRAVRAAAELRGDLAALNNAAERDHSVRLAARSGIATGDVVVGDPTLGRTATSGPPVTVAAPLQQQAGQGEVLVGDTTRRLLGEAAVVERVEGPVVDGQDRPLTAWRVLEMAAGVVAVPPSRARSRLLGREDELDRLHTALERASRDARGGLVIIAGDAGIGKSRLALEFAASVRTHAQVVTGHCPPYGEGVTFWPLREIVLEVAGGADREALVGALERADDAGWIAEQVAGAVGSADAPGRPDALFPAVRRLLETFARSRPLVVVVEDVHWAQPTLLELLEYLAGSLHAPVLLVCLARPEFLEQRKAWGQGLDNAATLALTRLGDGDIERLIADRSPGGTPEPDTARRIVELAQGNPLYVEQMLAALRDGHEHAIPLTLQALLLARLDRLGPAERDLVRAASVLGRHFTLPALLALLPTPARSHVRRHLEALERRELLVPSAGATAGDERFGFRHILIQLAAYRTLTKDARAELHERAADWLESGADEQAASLEEVIGYHFEQAHRYRHELGEVDARSRSLAVRAGERLGTAGMRAFGRFDAAAAENLLSRAQTLLPEDDPQRRTVRRTLAEAYQVMGRHQDADRVLAQLLEATSREDDAAGHHFLRLERARVRLAAGPDPVGLADLRDQAARALAVFDAAGDEVGLAQAHFLLALIHLRLGQPTEMEKVARRALDHAERSGSAREQLGARWVVAMALEPGSRPVDDCIRDCEELRAWRGLEHPGLLAELAQLRAMQGGFAEARELLARARRLLRERFRARRPVAGVAMRAAAVELLAGDLAAAEAELRSALQQNLDMDERDPVTHTAAMLSRLLSVRGSADEATRLAALSEDRAPSQSVLSQALWRTASARVLAARGAPDEAAALGREAIALAPPEMLNLGADLRVELAATLTASGQNDQAEAALLQARDLYERKGNLANAHRAAQRSHIATSRRK